MSERVKIENAQKPPVKEVLADVVKTFNSRTFSSPQDALTIIIHLSIRMFMLYIVKKRINWFQIKKFQ